MSAGPASRVRFQIALVVAWLIRPSSSAVRACTCSRQCPAATRVALTWPSAAATSAAHALAEAEEPTVAPDDGGSALPLPPNRFKATKLTPTRARVPAASHKTGILEFDFDRRARDIQDPSLDRRYEPRYCHHRATRRNPQLVLAPVRKALRAPIQPTGRPGRWRRRRPASSRGNIEEPAHPFVPARGIACDRLVTACVHDYAAVAALGGHGRQGSRIQVRGFGAA